MQLSLNNSWHTPCIWASSAPQGMLPSPSTSSKDRGTGTWRSSLSCLLMCPPLISKLFELPLTEEYSEEPRNREFRLAAVDLCLIGFEAFSSKRHLITRFNHEIRSHCGYHAADVLCRFEVRDRECTIYQSQRCILGEFALTDGVDQNIRRKYVGAQSNRARF